MELEGLVKIAEKLDTDDLADIIQSLDHLQEKH